MKRKFTAVFLTLALLASLCTVLAESESNDSRSTANTVEVNSAATGYISSSRDEDWYLLKVPYKGTASFSYSVADSSYVPYHLFRVIVYTYNSDYKAIYDSNTQRIRSHDLAPGTYYIRVCASSGSITPDEAYSKQYSVSTTVSCSHANTTEHRVERAPCSEYSPIETHCDDCGQVTTRAASNREPHTTDGEWTVTKEASCKMDGARLQKCSVCGETAITEKIPRLDHEIEWTTIRKATCSSTGQRTGKCSICEETSRETIDTLAHQFGDWSVASGTCIQEGEKKRTCELCGKQDTVQTDKGDHNFGDWIVTTEATCNREGDQYRRCSICREREDESIPQLDHTWFDKSLGVIDGKNAYIKTCSVCDTTSGRRRYEEVPKNADENVKGKKEITVTRANSSTPTVIVIVMPSFQDVGGDSWFQGAVAYAYNLGLMLGTSDTSFNPTGNMTLAEAVTMAARARNSYHGGSNDDFAASTPWHRVYVDYAIKHGIIKTGDFTDLGRTATRAEMAYIFAHTLPDEGMKAINTVTTLPDVAENDTYGAEIFALYRAGVLTGGDSAGTFSPNAPITRAEAATIITRVTLASERKSLTLG